MVSRIVPAIVVGCLLFAACGGGSDGDGGSTSTTSLAAEAPAPNATDVAATVPAPLPSTTVALVVEGATVVVANGNIIGGSAGRMTDALGLEGFTTGPAVNGSTKVEDSIVYYSSAEGAQVVAETLAVKLGGVSVEPLPAEVPTEGGTLEGGDVLLLLGSNQADKSIAQLSGAVASTPATATVTVGASVVVVANGSGVSGSAGRMTDVLKSAGFAVGPPTNSTAQATESVVYYGSDAAQADANVLATTLGGLTVLVLPADVPTDSGTLDGDILLVLGKNEADKTLADFAG